MYRKGKMERMGGGGGGDQKNAKYPPDLSENIIKQDGGHLWGLHQGQNSAIDEGFIVQLLSACPEPEFLNIYGAQESIPRNEFRQPI